MVSQIAWQAENQVLYIQLAGTITMDVLGKNADYAAKLLTETTGNQIHVIIDATKVMQFPKETGELRNALSTLLTHNRLGWTVIITRNVMLQSVFNRAVNRMNEKWGYVGTMQEALDLLRRADYRLPILSSSIANQAVLMKLK